MGMLKVTFEYFFLLIENPNNPTVILPEGSARRFPHQVILEHDGGSYAILGARRWRFQNTLPGDTTETPFVGGPFSSFPSANVLDLAEVSPGSTLKAENDWPKVNAIIEMPNGDFTSGGTVDQNEATTNWSVGSRDQRLSDRLLFECAIADDHAYSLRIGETSLPLVRDVDGDIVLLVRSLDQLPPDPAAPDFTGTLHEYLAIYDFLDLGGRPSDDLPLPLTQPKITFKKPARPICGGARIAPKA
ncbi:MAG: hypothetical protein AB7L71_15050 [Vicinamibacterales bacterium]